MHQHISFSHTGAYRKHIFTLIKHHPLREILLPGSILGEVHQLHLSIDKFADGEVNVVFRIIIIGSRHIIQQQPTLRSYYSLLLFEQHIFPLRMLIVLQFTVDRVDTCGHSQTSGSRNEEDIPAELVCLSFTIDTHRQHPQGLRILIINNREILPAPVHQSSR